MTGALFVWVDSHPRPGWHNMAVDEELLARAEGGERWLRLYRWEPTLSFGRHEPAERRYDARSVEQLGLSAVRRPTGGRAVWHDEELTYAVAAPSADLGGLREAYGEVHRVLLDAIQRVGAPAALAPSATTARGLGAGACFASPVGGEVVVAGGKIVGSAQVRRGGALLQHGSVLLEGDQAMVGRVTRGPAPADGSTSLARALGRSVSWQEAADAVLEAARRAWSPVMPSRPASVRNAERAAALRAPRYRAPTWTWQGAPGD